MRRCRTYPSVLLQAAHEALPLADTVCCSSRQKIMRQPPRPVRAQLAAESANVFVCKSMSKAYALSGLRVAYIEKRTKAELTCRALLSLPQVRLTRDFEQSHA